MNTAEHLRFMEQLEKWNEDERYQEAIDAVENLSEEEKTPEIISFLAKLYLNAAQPEERSLVKRALELLLSVEEEKSGEHNWNYRVGFAYYLLAQEHRALPYFEKALEYREGDEDTLEIIKYCKSRIELPRFDLPFAERAKKCWNVFLEEEYRLREILTGEKMNQEIVQICHEMLSIAFENVDFEIGHNGQKCELILSPNGDKAELFKLIYFRNVAPDEVLEHWNIIVGRQRRKENSSFEFQMYGVSIGLNDVEVWPKVLDAGQPHVSFEIEVYCEKILPLLKEEQNRAYGYMYILLDEAIGEIADMSYITSMDILEQRTTGESISLKELTEYMQNNMSGPSLENFDSAEALAGSFTTYRMTPLEDEEWIPRRDVFVGSARCEPLLREFLNEETSIMDSYHNDGLVAGFFFYPIADMERDEVYDFRDAFVAELEEKVEDAFTYLGGATGTMFGYIDFIAWDFERLLDTAKEMFENRPVPEAAVQTYRAGNVYYMLKS